MSDLEKYSLVVMFSMGGLLIFFVALYLLGFAIATVSKNRSAVGCIMAAINIVAALFLLSVVAVMIVLGPSLVS